MSSELKQKTISGLTWSFADTFFSNGITFIVGIILARLLEPKEFGLIGMITIVIAISTSVIDSGFSQALIRKNNCTDIDYSTVFYFNFISGVFFFVILFVSAPYISIFFKEPQLTALVRVLAVVLIIDSLTIIQRTILTKRLNFKLQTKISIVASIISGIISIFMALKGFGVWSLVARQVSQRAVNSLLLWIWNRWYPILIFSKNSFLELYSFGYKLLISGLINTAYQNIYYAIIGKYFSATELGYYTRADQFRKLPSTNINSVIQRVTYPVLASIQDDRKRLKANYRRLIKSTVLITFILMIGMAAVAEPLIITLIGDKWRTSVGYLQMLCFVGMMYPLHSLNLNMLKVQGRSDLFLKLEIIKRIIALPTIIIGILFGIKIMIIGMIINSFIAYYLNSYYSGSQINYSMKEQILDILPILLLAILNGIVVFLIGIFLPLAYWLKLLIQVLSGGILIILFCEIFRLESYRSIKDVVSLQFKLFLKNNNFVNINGKITVE